MQATKRPSNRHPMNTQTALEPAPAPSILMVYFLLTLTVLFWGGNAIAGKLAVGHISPMLLTTIRWALAFSIMIIIGWKQAKRDWPELKKHMPLLCAYGALGFASFNVTLYSALQYTSAINVTIEQAAMPIIIFVANFILFKTRVYTIQIIGFVLTLMGVIITVTQGDLSRLIALDLNRGDAIMLLAVVLYGGYTVALRYKPKLHWKSLLVVMSLAAFFTSLPFATWEYLAGNTILPTPQGWMVSAYTAIFPAILSQAFFIYGVTAIGPNRAGIFVNMVPVFGALLSILILGEHLQSFHIIGMALVLGGIALAERKQN